MKKLLILLTALLLLTSCTNDTAVGLSGTETPQNESDYFTGDTLEFLAASSGFCADGRLYSCSGGFVRYMNLETGEERVLCYDPLCSHGNAEITNDCECVAYHAQDGFLSRVLADDGKVWFLADVSSGLPGDFTRYFQLRCIDLEDMSLSVYLQKNEMYIYDFWKYGDDIYLSMPREIKDENGRISYSGGSIYRLGNNGKLTMVLEDTDDVQFQLLASGEGCVYYCGKFGSGTIYKTTPDFAYTETAAELNSVYNIRISGGYIYYMKKTGNSYRLDGEALEGDFDEDVSNRFLAGNEYALYRRREESDAEEIVYASMPQVRSNSVLNLCAYCVDAEDNRIYLTPLDMTYEGYAVWEQNAMMMQMGASGKDVLTQIFSETNGRILALDCETLETAAEYTVPGVDVLDICGVKNGRLTGQFRLKNVDELKKIWETDGLNSKWEYDQYGVTELNEDN